MGPGIRRRAPRALRLRDRARAAYDRGARKRARAMSEPRTALVIGGGVIGVCAAYYLARAGVTVTLVEQADIAAGSSSGNAGLVVPSHSIPLAAPGVWWKGLRWMANPESPLYIRPRLDRELAAWLLRFRSACSERHLARAVPLLRDLGYESRRLYRELAGLAGLDFGYQENGVLLVCHTAKGLAQGVHEAEVLGAAGIPARPLDAAATRALEPSLAPTVVGGVLFPDDAQLVPDAFVSGLAEVAAKLGVDVRRATEVIGFRMAGDRIVAVETTRGDLAADEIVLAAGSWSPGLGRSLGLRLPIQPAKGYSVTARRPLAGPRIPLLLAEARMAITPMAERLRLAGTLELAGMDFSINRRRVDALVRAARDYLAGLEPLEGVEIWRGLRPCAPDGLPIVGRPVRIRNLVVATGHAMIGMSLGPVTGRLVAQLLSGEPPALDVTALSPQRFR
jgi:D-amino-acid dehydrogenase